MSEQKVSRLRLRSSSITTIVSLSLVLFMLGLVGVILLNTHRISDYLKENIGFQLIIKENAKDPDINKLQKTLDASDYVKSTDYITKEDAAKTMQQDLGEDFITFLGYNPLLASINIHLKAEYAHPDSVSWIVSSMEDNKIVKEVVYQKLLIEKLNENMNKLAFIILGFSIILMVIALALINNTIRLAIYSKRFIIKTMQLVGATRGFIRMPFILRGIRQGIFGSAIAIIMLIILLYVAEEKLPELKEIQDTVLLAKLFALVMLLGIIIGGVSTSMAVRKYLRLRTSELYY